MAECLTVQEISNIAGGSSTSSNFPNVNECPNKTEAESNWKVTVTDGASTNELVTSAKKSMRRIYVHFDNESDKFTFNLHLNTNVGGFDFTKDSEEYYVDVSYDKTNLIVTDVLGTIGNTDKYDWLAQLALYNGSYTQTVVWSQRLQPLQAVTLENYPINRNYYMGSSDIYHLYVNLIEAA